MTAAAEQDGGSLTAMACGAHAGPRGAGDETKAGGQLGLDTASP
jgi:hypothetical protein